MVEEGVSGSARGQRPPEPKAGGGGRPYRTVLVGLGRAPLGHKPQIEHVQVPRAAYHSVVPQRHALGLRPGVIPTMVAVVHDRGDGPGALAVVNGRLAVGRLVAAQCAQHARVPVSYRARVGPRVRSVHAADAVEMLENARGVGRHHLGHRSVHGASKGGVHAPQQRLPLIRIEGRAATTAAHRLALGRDRVGRARLPRHDDRHSGFESSECGHVHAHIGQEK